MPKTLTRIRNEGEAEPGLHCPVEDIAQAYLTSTAGDAEIALRCAITDALSDLMQAERRAVLGLEPQELAAPVRACERLAHESGRDLAGLMGPADVRVGVVDGGYPPAEDRLERAPLVGRDMRLAGERERVVDVEVRGRDVEVAEDHRRQLARPINSSP